MKKLLLAALWLFAAPAFAQSVYYSNNDDHASEVAAAAANLAASLGGTATAFNASSDAEWSTALASATHIFVGQGAGLNGLAGGTVTDATNWVSNGGVMLLLGGNTNTETLPFLNSVTGASMVTGSCESSGSSKVPTKTASVNGTTFDAAPATISAAVSNWCAITLASLSGTAIPAYVDQVDDVHVLLEPVGSGTVAYFSWDFCCSADGPGELEGWEAALLAAAGFAGGAAASRATFEVTKEFTDDNPNGVEVTISCNTGLPLEQSQVITEAEGVKFVVVEYDSGELDCEITEDVPNGYDAEYFDGTANSSTSCEYLDQPHGAANSCRITNTPLPVDVDINKDWVFEGTTDGEGLDLRYELTLWCNAEIVNGTQVGVPGVESPSGDNGPGGCGLIQVLQEGQQGFVFLADWCKTFEGEGPLDATHTAQVIPEYPSSNCYVVENVYDNAVEVSNGCTSLTVSAGQGTSCTVTNTVFFEGIPTLNQYGLALLALLMLGIGAVGFRRYG